MHALKTGMGLSGAKSKDIRCSLLILKLARGAAARFGEKRFPVHYEVILWIASTNLLIIADFADEKDLFF